MSAINFDPHRLEPYSPAEAREIARAAWREAVERAMSQVYSGGRLVGSGELCAEAETRYPAPVVTRPRVLTLAPWEGAHQCDFRVTDGTLQWAHAGHENWTPFWGDIDAGDGLTPQLLRGIADLQENPTETVPADEVIA